MKQYLPCVVILLASASIVLGACKSASSLGVTPRSVEFGAKLDACNRESKTCTESIECENRVRLSFSRPMRDVDAGCQ